jgi:hypothetical protein
MTGKDLEYMEYEQLMPFVKTDKKSFYVTVADYVTTEDGTGIVHTAPAFGEDDYQTGRRYNLPVLQPVNREGKFQILYAHQYAKGEETDPEYQVRDICRLMDQFKIAYCIADSGDGFAQGKKLKSMFGARFDMCYYSANQRKKRIYNTDK